MNMEEQIIEKDSVNSKLDELKQLQLIEDEDTQKDKFLTFRIGNEDYAIDIKYINEIISIQKITSVPNIKKYIKGIINLRGNIIPVIDVRLRFHIDEKEYTDKTCIVVTSINNVHVGLIVDEVSEVLSIPEDKISPPPQTNKGAKSRYIQGIGKDGQKVKVMINLFKLLYDEEKPVMEN